MAALLNWATPFQVGKLRVPCWIFCSSIPHRLSLLRHEWNLCRFVVPVVRRSNLEVAKKPVHRKRGLTTVKVRRIFSQTENRMLAFTLKHTMHPDTKSFKSLKRCYKFRQSQKTRRLKDLETACIHNPRYFCLATGIPLIMVLLSEITLDLRKQFNLKTEKAQGLKSCEKAQHLL